MITAQQWDNFDRLVAHLQQLPEAKFNYMQAVMTDGCGCVSAHVCALNGAYVATEQWLGLSSSEASALWNPCAYGSRLFSPTPEHMRVPYGSPNVPWIGNKADALRRLAILEARYARPVATWTPDDGAFLAGLRILAAEARPEAVEVVTQ